MDYSEKLIDGDGEERDGPPTLSDEMFAQLDQKVTLEEVERLQKLEVFGRCRFLNETEQALIFDTTCVFDWRCTGKWKKRCRIVARKYRTSNTDETQFSPTPASFTMKLVIVLGAIFNLQLFVADIKDASSAFGNENWWK